MLHASFRTFFRLACISGVPWSYSAHSPELEIEGCGVAGEKGPNLQASRACIRRPTIRYCSIKCHARHEISGLCWLIWALHPCFAMQVRCKWLDMPATPGNHLDHRFPRQKALWGSRCSQFLLSAASVWNKRSKSKHDCVRPGSL